MRRLRAAAVVLQCAADAASVPARMFAAAVMKASGGEGWAEPDPALPRIEAQCIDALLALWSDLERRMLEQLGLPSAKAAPPPHRKAGEDAFVFDARAHLAALLQIEQAFIAAAGTDAGPLVRQAFAAWLRGLENARTDVGDAAADVSVDVRRAYRSSLQTRGLQLVRSATARAYREGIVQTLVDGEYDGMNPLEVARKLRARFGAGEYDWERLARSEIAMAQVDGKAAEYLAAGITRVDYITAQDGRVSSICRSHAAGSPYPINKAPVPVRDSHPNCRCSWKPVLED